MKTVNINIVAKEAGVSTATVSRALNGNSSIKDSTRQKILEVADRYDYRPSHLARGLMTKRTDTIGLILPELADDFFMQVVNSIDEEVHKVNNFLMVASSHSQRDSIETMMDFMASGRVDGVLIMAPKIQGRVQYLSRKKNKPVVYLNSCKCKTESVNFTVDNYGGAKSVVQHLISHGYKRIAIIKGPKGNCEADDRALGFQDALLENGIDIDEELMINGDFRVNTGYHGFLRLFNQKRKPEAIFAANDMMAVGIFQAANSLSISIPKDVAVAGFDDIYLSKVLIPRLTTVHVPIADLASNAVQYLIKMINGEISINKSFCTEFTANLVIGSSCGCNQKNGLFF
jgi:LacI family transcriptional regulator